MAGGYGDDSRISSTEVLASTSSAWVLANNLPRKLYGVSSVTLGNIIYLIGEYNIVGWGTDNIFDQVELTMTVILETRCTNGMGRIGWKLGR